MLQQRAMIGSAVLNETGALAPPLVFDRRGDTHFEACDGLPRAPYLVAVASDREPPPLPHSLYIDRNDLDTEHRRLIELGGDLRHAQELLTRTETELASAMAAATAATQRALQMAQANAESVRQINVLQGELARAARERPRARLAAHVHAHLSASASRSPVPAAPVATQAPDQVLQQVSGAWRAAMHSGRDANPGFQLIIGTL